MSSLAKQTILPGGLAWRGGLVHMGKGEVAGGLLDRATGIGVDSPQPSRPWLCVRRSDLGSYRSSYSYVVAR